MSLSTLHYQRWAGGMVCFFLTPFHFVVLLKNCDECRSRSAAVFSLCKYTLLGFPRNGVHPAGVPSFLVSKHYTFVTMRRGGLTRVPDIAWDKLGLSVAAKNDITPTRTCYLSAFCRKYSSLVLSQRAASTGKKDHHGQSRRFVFFFSVRCSTATQSD